MKKLKKWLALFVMAGILSAAPVPVLAFTDEAAQVEVAPETEIPVVIEETVPETEATSFSIPGNGELVDDKTDDDTKQFLTIRTKNGNTFFLVLDRSSNTENVYMLSMIDENDLAEFVEEVPEKQTETEPEIPQVVIPETEVTPVETEPETEPEKQPEAMDMRILLGALILAGGIGGFYYLKVVKPKKAEEDADGEDLEFYDGGACVNEDTENEEE